MMRPGKRGTDPNAWMVTFGDLLMLMLTFFVFLLAMKSMDHITPEKIFDYFLEVGKGGEVTAEDSPENSMPEKNADRKKHFILTSAMLRKTLKKDYANFRKRFGIYEDGRGVIITLDSESLFDPGKAVIRKEKMALLERVGDLFSHISNDIVILGHTDNTPLGGGRSNWELSFYRALSVFNYLTGVYGLEPSRIATGGCGDVRPLAPNTDQVNRARNRRVEFLLRKK